MDYVYFNDRNDPRNRPVLVVHDSASQGVWAIAADNKGESEYVVKRLCEQNERRGDMRVVINSDQEPSIAQVDRDVKDQLHRISESVAEGADVMGAAKWLCSMSAANGMIESTIQRVHEQARALKLDIEASAGVRINPSFPT